MDPLEQAARSGIYLLMGAGVLGALGAVLFRNLFYSGLSLAAVLLSIAGIFISLGADFLAMVQILIYIGAVMTLIIYAIMLTARLADTGGTPSHRQRIPALAACAVFAVLLGGALLRAGWPAAERTVRNVSVQELGISLMTQYVFPFEITGLLLLAVLVGAIVLARRDRA